MELMELMESAGEMTVTAVEVMVEMVVVVAVVMARYRSRQKVPRYLPQKKCLTAPAETISQLEK
jgi:acetamidase/formamidase